MFEGILKEDDFRPNQWVIYNTRNGHSECITRPNIEVEAFVDGKWRLLEWREKKNFYTPFKTELRPGLVPILNGKQIDGQHLARMYDGDHY